MHRWGPRLDWEHLQNWVPGVLGVAAVILLVVVAANSPTPTNSKLDELPSSQSAAPAAKSQTDATPVPSQPAAPQPSSVTDKVAKAPAPPVPPPAATTGEAAKPPPMHDHAVVKAEAVAAPAPVQGAAKPDKEPQKAVADATGLQGDAVADVRSSRNVRRAILWTPERPSWVQVWPGSSVASRAPNPISIIRRL